MKRAVETVVASMMSVFVLSGCLFGSYSRPQSPTDCNDSPVMPIVMGVGAVGLGALAAGAITAETGYENSDESIEGPPLGAVFGVPLAIGAVALGVGSVAGIASATRCSSLKQSQVVPSLPGAPNPDAPAPSAAFQFNRHP